MKGGGGGGGGGLHRGVDGVCEDGTRPSVCEVTCDTIDDLDLQAFFRQRQQNHERNGQ